MQYSLEAQDLIEDMGITDPNDQALVEDEYFYEYEGSFIEFNGRDYENLRHAVWVNFFLELGISVKRDNLTSSRGVYLIGGRGHLVLNHHYVDWSELGLAVPTMAKRVVKAIASRRITKTDWVLWPKFTPGHVGWAYGTDSYGRGMKAGTLEIGRLVQELHGIENDLFNRVIANGKKRYLAYGPPFPKQ
jgi:hypothetical protein